MVYTAYKHGALRIIQNLYYVYRLECKLSFQALEMTYYFSGLLSEAFVKILGKGAFGVVELWRQKFNEEQRLGRGSSGKRRSIQKWGASQLDHQAIELWAAFCSICWGKILALFKSFMHLLCQVRCLSWWS